MNHFIIDGNNVIGRIPALSSLQKKDKQLSREKLAFLVERFFANRKVKLTLHFDGFSSLPLKVSKVKIIYSEKLSADENIKKQIGDIKNRRTIIVITSDSNLSEYARICGCSIQSSDEFGKLLFKKKEIDDEDEKIRQMSNEKNIQEFKNIFQNRNTGSATNNWKHE